MKCDGPSRQACRAEDSSLDSRAKAETTLGSAGLAAHATSGDNINNMPVTYETIRRIAGAFPHVEESTSYGTPALKVKGKLFVRLREDPDSLVVKMPFDQREEMMANDPDTYYVTDHYRPYEWMLVRLSKVHPDALPGLLQTAYRAAVPSKKRRP